MCGLRVLAAVSGVRTRRCAALGPPAAFAVGAGHGLARCLVRRAILLLLRCGGLCFAAGLAFCAPYAHALGALRCDTAAREWPLPPVLRFTVPCCLRALAFVMGSVHRRSRVGGSTAARARCCMGVVSLLRGGWGVWCMWDGVHARCAELRMCVHCIDTTELMLAHMWIWALQGGAILVKAGGALTAIGCTFYMNTMETVRQKPLSVLLAVPCVDRRV